MPKRSSIPPDKPTDADDPNVVAFNVVQKATGGKPAKPSKPAKNPAAVALGRMGGKKGGKARAASLTPEQRSEIARKAAVKRWGEEKK